MTANKHFGRSVPFDLRYQPQAAYRLPPIMAQPAMTHPPYPIRRPPPPQPLTWRPVR